MVLKVTGIFSDKIFFQRPPVESAVPDGGLSRNLRHHLVVLNLFQRKTVCRIVPGTERLHKNKFTGRNLVMYIPSSNSRIAFDIFGLESHTFLICLRDYEQIETK